MAANVICSKCGQENGAEQTFCGSCGAFLEWSGEQVAAERPDQAGEGEPTGAPAAPAAVPQPVVPVRPRPARRSVPPGHLDSTAATEPESPGPRPVTPAEATIACPACGRANPAARNFCHSCGTLLRPRPRAPMARRRRSSGGTYRLLSIILLIAIILVGSFLVTRLTTSGGPGPSPSPTRAAVTRLLGG